MITLRTMLNRRKRKANTLLIGRFFRSSIGAITCISDSVWAFLYMIYLCLGFNGQLLLSYQSGSTGMIRIDRNCFNLS